MIKFNGMEVVFGKCVVDLVGGEGRHVSLEDYGHGWHELLLQQQSRGVPLLHARECPCRVIREESTEDNDKVLLAACVAVEVRGVGVLVTRRAAHMRTFAEVYVLPGGHLDERSLAECAERELREETGLTLPHNAHLRPLAVYESVFPVEQRHQERPKRHHLVMYYHVMLDEMPKLECDPKELDRYCWLSRATIAKVLDRSCGPDQVFKCYKLDGTEEDASMYSLMGIPDPITGKYEKNRLSTGTQMVLKVLISSDENESKL